MDDSSSSNNAGEPVSGSDPNANQLNQPQPVNVSSESGQMSTPQPAPATSSQLSTQAPEQSQTPQAFGEPMYAGPQPIAKKPRAKWLLPVVFAGILLLGGGAAAYVTVFQKTPEKLWSRALSNTAEGLDKMVQNGINDPDKGMSIDGTLEVSSPVAIDGTVKGAWYETTGSMTADISVSGAEISVEARTIGENATSTPDMYLKVKGLDQIDALTGGLLSGQAGDMITGIEDQWFFLDKTLIDQALLQASEETPSLSQEDIEQISTKVMTVVRDRMLASDESGVFTVLEKIGKEEFEGTDSYKVKVGVNKENFKLFVTELKDALKGTKAEELLKASDPDKTLEEAIDFEELLKQIDDADFSKATADVWIEGNGGYIRNIRIFPEEGNMKSYFDIGMKYEGADSFPLTLRVTMDEEDSKGTLTLGMDINPNNGDATMTVKADMNLEGEEFKMDMTMAIKGSDEQVTVEKPEGAMNVLELLSGLQSQADSFDLSAPSGYEDLYYTEPSLLDDQQLQ